LSSHRHGPLIAQLLVAMLLLGSMPMAASPVVYERESTPSITLAICHPLSVFATGAASCALAAFTGYSFSIVSEDRDPTEASGLVVIDRASEAPDPPPPKALA
jgi:hypothetical protein